ncbi:hypothetical protein ACFU99_26005 [Streptomyces sp. NPDC057654]|uniref:hypothetical protein n=1 Tax=Streptomyces sp. NPDC057654 TaxID=3346196 RepID=UPI003689805F
MAAVTVTISPTRPTKPPPYATRPAPAAAAPVATITPVPRLDEVMNSAMCPCNAGDDNPR